jgi:hypothetical protein
MMPEVGKSWFAASLLTTYTALFLGNCGGESLNGSGAGGTTGGTTGRATGGTTGEGGFLDGAGGLTGTGNAPGSGGLATGGVGGDWGGAGGDIGVCNAIIVYPPVLTIVDGASGNPVCDPTFAIVDVNASNPIVIADVQPCDGTSGVTCPGSPGEEKPGPCRFILNGLGSSSVGTLEVSAPGYLSSEVLGVSGGVGGCVPYRAPSQLTVSLWPVLPVPTDGGVDAH